MKLRRPLLRVAAAFHAKRRLAGLAPAARVSWLASATVPRAEYRDPGRAGREVPLISALAFAKCVHLVLAGSQLMIASERWSTATIALDFRRHRNSSHERRRQASASPLAQRSLAATASDQPMAKAAVSEGGSVSGIAAVSSSEN